MAKPQALVLYGDGINCERETSFALTLAGFETCNLQVGEFLESTGCLNTVQLLAFPGGFSFGDDIASGKVLAIKLKTKALDALLKFIDGGKLVLGICNGFQVLTQLGLLPDPTPATTRTVSLTHNAQGRFINRWVKLTVAENHPSLFFRGLKEIELPIRHGEGRLTLGTQHTAAIENQIKQLAPLRYTTDVNGSFDRIAALTNKKGNVLGLMPHPEAYIRHDQHPAWATMNQQNRSTLIDQPHGLRILTNAIAAL